MVFNRFIPTSFRKQLFLIVLLFSLIVSLLISDRTLTNTFRNTEILWDTYGVPHIYGKNNQSLFYAFGWAQMHSHGNLLLRLYGQARGSAAEYWGEKYLESDQWLRTLGVPTRAQQWYEAQDLTFRSYLDAFAAGVNAYAQSYPELIDDEVEVVLPVKAVDILAHSQRLLHFLFMVEPETLAQFNEQWQMNAFGSNAWAIAPSRSASGKAMLLANPHLPWSEPFLWYEAQLTAPGVDSYGAALVGIPVLAIAFNDKLGWTHTVNPIDGWDIYELTLSDGGYQWEGNTRPFETERQILKVKQTDKTLREEPLLIRRSIHGPVIAAKNGKAIALRVAGLDQPNALEQWWEMGCADNLTQFETALKRLQIPMFNVIYADRDGHILYLFNGRVPIRSLGDFKYWSGIIPGDTAKTLWQKTHSYNDLPRVLDPPSGWLQNANDPPWTTTFPPLLDPDDYPAYLAPRGPMSLRSQHSARMLAEDEQISFEEVIKYKHSTQMELAERLLDELIAAAQKQGGEPARRAVKVLQNWDRRADAQSRGAVLFAFWTQAVDFSNLFAVPWDENAPLTTPAHLANPASAVAALETAAIKVETLYGRLDVPWGEVFRLRFGDLDLAANGGSDQLGIFRSLWFTPSQKGRFQAIGGDSYVAVIEFSDPVKAMVLNSYGNATQSQALHQGMLSLNESLKLFTQKQLRSVWRSRSEIEAHLASRQVINFEKLN